jgi:protein-glutamine gamma-glutamyltransferase
VSVSATASALRVPAPAAASGAPRAWRLRPRVPAAFAALALLAGLRFAALLTHPPAVRVLAIVAAATLAGGALAATAALAGHARVARLARLAILALCAYLSLRAAGAPARPLWPWRWPALAHELARGLDALDGLWPYTGHAARARLAVMLVLPATIVPAAALAFWPRAGAKRELRAGSLALLLGLYAAAAANQSRAGWQVQGVLLLALVGLWGWAWSEHRADGPRALAWLAVLACLALLGATLAGTTRPLLHYRAWNPFGPAFPPTRFDWNQRYGPRSWPNSTETMVEVAARRPELWRVSALDRFDGVRFMRSAAPPPGTSGLAGVRLRPQWLERATYTVRGLSSAQLLSPGAPVALDSPVLALRGHGRLAPDGTISVAGASPREGQRYTVTGYAPRPSVAEMRSAPRGYPAAYAAYLALELPGSRTDAHAWSAAAGEPARIEDSPYGGVYALARRLAAGAPSAYDVAAHVEAFLRSGLRYDESPPRRAYPLAAFLLRDRAGYCEQFAGAMALMLRMDGLPARVVAGFQPGTRSRASGLYEVSARDAHDWVEVFFAGIGWVAFDPTPAAAGAGGAGAGLAPLAASVSGAGLSGGRGESARTRRPSRSRARGASGVRGAHGASQPALAVWIAAALAAALALALALGVVSRRLARSLAGGAEGALAELSGALARLGGAELAPGTTLAELERRLALSHGSDASRYVGLLRERRYAPAADARLPGPRERRALRRALCAGRGPIVRLRALLALPPAGSWTQARPRGRSRRTA